MKIKIAHYYGQTPPVPEAVLYTGTKMVNQPIYEVEIPDDGLFDFVEQHGSIILSPPSKTPFFGEWFIWVTDSTGRFVQK